MRPDPSGLVPSTTTAVFVVDIFARSLDEAVRTVIDKAKRGSGSGGYVGQCNVRVLTLTPRVPRLRSALEHVAAIFPDGAPVGRRACWRSRFPGVGGAGEHPASVRPRRGADRRRDGGRHRQRHPAGPRSAEPRAWPHSGMAWQVMGPSAIPFEPMVKLDYVCVSQWSLLNDLKLIRRTIPSLAAGSNSAQR